MSYASFFAPLRGTALAEVQAEFFERTAAAEVLREAETRAGMRLQAAWRGYKSRDWLQRLYATVLLLERLLRGFLGRKRARQARLERDLSRQRAVFDAVAVVIQKRYRAFCSRKYRHNFYARKAYVAAVVHKSETVRRKLSTTLEQQVEQRRQEQDDKARARVEHLASKLHHLRSTESCASIYASPYHIGYQPTAFGVPVEQHLRDAIRPIVKKELTLRKKTLQPLPTPAPIPPRLEPGLRDVEVREAARMDRALEKGTRLGGSDFVTAPISSGDFQRYQGSVNASAKFQPPLRSFERPVTKSSWVSQQPFYNAAPRNRLVCTDKMEQTQ